MILPLFGFLTGVFISSIVGVLFLWIHPKWKVNIYNLIWFVGGAFLGAALLGFAYGQIFSSAKGELESGGRVLGFFFTAGVGLLGGGIAGLYFMLRYWSKPKA